MVEARTHHLARFVYLRLDKAGIREFVSLSPGEFRIVESVRLDPDEKSNAE